MNSPWAPGWEAVTAIATALLFLATVALVVTAAITISRNTKALELQNRLLELETKPLLSIQLARRNEVGDVNHWTTIEPRNDDQSKLQLGGLISTDQVVANAEWAGFTSQPQTNAWEIFRITNTGRSPAIRCKAAVKLFWNTVTIDATQEGGALREQHMSDGVFDVPTCPAGGSYRIGVINTTGLVVRIATGDKATIHRPTIVTEEEIQAVVPVPIKIRARL